MGSELATIKGYTLPIHAIPQDHEVIRALVRDLCILLSINPEDEKNAKRIPMTELMIRESANRLTPAEIRKAFVMYAKGELPDLEPKDNYLTPILFNKVVTAYKKTKQVQHQPLPPVSDDPEIAMENALQAYRDYKETGDVSRQYASVFDRFVEWGIFPKKGTSKAADKKYEWYLHQAFGKIYDEIHAIIKREMAKPGASTPELFEAKRRKTEMFQEKWAYHEIQSTFRCMVLASFFSKITEEELKAKIWKGNSPPTGQ